LRGALAGAAAGGMSLVSLIRQSDVFSAFSNHGI
jgi:hypothetical protein